MTTRIEDMVVPALLAKYMLEQSIEKNALVNSGLIVQNPQISAGLQSGGLTFTFPSIKHIDASIIGNVSSSDAGQKAVAQKASTAKQVAVRNERNIVLSSADLTASVAGVDPMAGFAAQLGLGLTKVRSTTLRSQLTGVLGKVTSNVNDTASAFNADELIDTTGAWGDMADDKMTVLLFNSKTHRMLKKQQATAFIPSALTPVGFQSYLGMPYLVDDKIADGSIMLIQAGAIEFGQAQHKNAVAVERDELAGNGGGVETIVARDIFSYHVVGTKFTGTPAAELPTDAELADPANWALALDSKLVGVAQYKFTA